MTITQQELEARLLQAANALRGPVDPADFKTYVFPMLFWKWISDAWQYERAEAIGEYADEITDEIEADYHRFDLPAGTARARQLVTWSTKAARDRHRESPPLACRSRTAAMNARISSGLPPPIVVTAGVPPRRRSSAATASPRPGRTTPAGSTGLVAAAHLRHHVSAAWYP